MNHEKRDRAVESESVWHPTDKVRIDASLSITELFHEVADRYVFKKSDRWSCDAEIGSAET
jgi:hypothetical protein